MSSKGCSCCRRLKAWSFLSLHLGRERPFSDGHASPLYDTINSTGRLTYPATQLLVSIKEYGLALAAPQARSKRAVTLPCPRIGRGGHRRERRVHRLVEVGSRVDVVVS